MALDRQTVCSAGYKWWSAFRQGTEIRPGMRGTLARLRRADNALDALREAEVFGLLGDLKLISREAFANDEAYRAAAAPALSRVAVLASVLAHVNTHEKMPFGRALGPPRNGDSAKLKPLRLARLLAARGDEEIRDQFRRAVQLLDGSANVSDLAWLILVWDRDEIGDRARTLFAFAYHDAAAHAPSEDGPSDDEAQ
ncbi:hypothetical protein APY04_0053 [Hyphomicrobium sulfonivorans]|uniref:CRISPR-associated protein, Cse2 family n=1 Tax=Hyphomicrobium sulfonivorans TaxID=121290 RepID=A0A109BPZ1_HYPSL|nr:type I-E CRISPR-associated protein Cse2/CasB [Hyphomicrobium sulfonivorans]KWT72786.1 hypothetical protein APY04_0053 [Hyphomicrobium sulfonivorans]